MADIFVSYKREDQERVSPLVEALTREGFSVWWDAHIHGGAAWRRAIETELNAARCVIVVWSRDAVGPAGEFVQDEASIAKVRGVYLPVRIDPVEAPLGFRQSQVLDLTAWAGERESGPFQGLLRAIHTLVEPLKAAGLAVEPPDPEAALPPASKRPTLAVLPFLHAADDEDVAMFAEALAEDLIAGLSRSRLVAVKPRQSSLSYDAERKTAPQVCADLGVDYVVQGRIRRLGSRIRLSAELVSGEDNSSLWSTRHDCQIEDPIDLLEEMAVAIVGAIEPAVLENEQSLSTRRGARRAGHWELFVRGRRLFWRSTYAEMKEAQTLFERALDLEPEDSPTLSLLSHCHMFYVWAGVTRDLDGEIKASHDLALRAVACDAADSFAHFSLGVTLEMLRRTAEARAEFLRALQLNPFQAAAAGMMGRLAAFAGDVEAAEDWSRRAIAMSPNDPHLFIWRLNKAAAAFAAEDYPVAISGALETVAHAPYLFGNHFMLAAAYAAAGQIEPARQAYEAGRRIKSRYPQEALRITFPFAREPDADRFVQALRVAGWTG